MKKARLTEAKFADLTVRVWRAFQAYEKARDWRKECSTKEARQHMVEIEAAFEAAKAGKEDEASFRAWATTKQRATYRALQRAQIRLQKAALRLSRLTLTATAAFLPEKTHLILKEIH